MKRYTTDIADMKVSLYCSGLDQEVKKLSQIFEESDDTLDADIAIIFAAYADKTVCSLLDRMEEEGTTATLTALVLGEAPSKTWHIVDLCVVAAENQRRNALADLLSMLDYYTYCQPVDVGSLLQRRGSVVYQPLGEAAHPADVEKQVKEHLIGKNKALLFLNVGEDVWDSEVLTLCEALSEATGQTALSVSAVRTLPERHLYAALFIG